MDPLQEYIDAVAPGHRPLFDRVNGLILEEFPQASVALSYGMPTYRVEKRRLHIGVWQQPRSRRVTTASCRVVAMTGKTAACSSSKRQPLLKP
ncbi:hypothetical protein ACFPFX_30730 [Streptomyces mauvecolor]|uniref:YdhG-like domain-containing protein n=1 Tax=Streptomyces mauvecolor TaxID=58345 RepID=A0ABV9UWB2_9ACTN